MSTQITADGRRLFFLLPIGFPSDPTDWWASVGAHTSFCPWSPSSTLSYAPPPALLSGSQLHQVAPRCQEGGNGHLVPDSSLVDPWAFTEGCRTLVFCYVKDPSPSGMAVPLKDGRQQPRLSQYYMNTIIIFTFPWLFNRAFPSRSRTNPIFAVLILAKGRGRVGFLIPVAILCVNSPLFPWTVYYLSSLMGCYRCFLVPLRSPNSPSSLRHLRNTNQTPNYHPEFVFTQTY